MANRHPWHPYETNFAKTGESKMIARCCGKTLRERERELEKT